MIKAVRYALFLVCAVQVIMAVAFFLQLPLAVGIWPFPGSTPMTFIFLSSIYAAAAVSTFWAVASKNYGALAGIGLDYIMILAPLSAVCFRLKSGATPGMTGWAIVSLAGAIIGLLLVLWSIRIPMDRTIPLPRFARWAFVGFIASLLAVSLALILRLPNVIPWTVTPALSVVIGSMFLGAASYFLYGLLRPSWVNAGGQFAGFLAYDLVLIGPFISLFATVEPERLPSLIVYTVFVSFSGLVALYYLFVYGPTRLRMTSGRSTGQLAA